MHALLKHFDDGLWGLSRTPNLFADFDRLFADFGPQPSPRAARATSDLKFEETDDGYSLTVELPGLTDKDVEVQIDEGVLTVAGKREVTTPDGYQATHRERRNIEFSRSFRLGKEIDVEGIAARMKDGVLSLTLPKRSAPKPLQIPVQTH